MDVGRVYAFILCLCCPVFRQRPRDELITRPRSPTVCKKWLRNWIRGQGPEWALRAIEKKNREILEGILFRIGWKTSFFKESYINIFPLSGACYVSLRSNSSSAVTVFSSCFNWNILLCFIVALVRQSRYDINFLHYTLGTMFENAFIKLKSQNGFFSWIT
jgi:hypothetical protein